ncbi:hypothetical protein TcWFU_001508 [Taenia crassiceps]|uniref:Uncharacterized protein n=1 Tax=Taenia crassiceps TaxID=6207 RepID=A0ABR4QP43_9CEST
MKGKAKKGVCAKAASAAEPDDEWDECRAVFVSPTPSLPTLVAVLSQHSQSFPLHTFTRLITLTVDVHARVLAAELWWASSLLAAEDITPSLRQLCPLTQNMCSERFATFVVMLAGSGTTSDCYCRTMADDLTRTHVLQSVRIVCILSRRYSIPSSAQPRCDSDPVHQNTPKPRFGSPSLRYLKTMPTCERPPPRLPFPTQIGENALSNHRQKPRARFGSSVPSKSEHDCDNKKGAEGFMNAPKMFDYDLHPSITDMIP